MTKATPRTPQKAGLRNLIRQSVELVRFLRAVDVAQEVNAVIARLEAGQRHLEQALCALRTDLDATRGNLAASRRDMDATLRSLRSNISVSRADFPAPPLPAGLRTIEMTDGEDKSSCFLVVADPPTQFDELVISQKQVSGLAVLLKKMLNGAGTLLDIGAHIGSIALPIAVAGSRVVAIEMNPANCLRLVHGAIVNRLRNFQVVPFAASHIDGLAAFSGTDAWGYISKEVAAVPTMCVRLDTLAYSMQLGLEGASLAEPVVMKIDVECHELQVLRGCPILLQRYRPIIIFESKEIEGWSDASPPLVSGETRVTKQFLVDRGYSIYRIDWLIGLLVPRSPNDVQEACVSDFLAVPAEKAASVERLGMPVRPLSSSERLRSISEMANWPEPPHQRHAAGVVLRLAADEPGFSSTARAIIETLLTKPAVEAVWPRLARLLS
jgi:FkbM family methyltransferase